MRITDFEELSKSLADWLLCTFPDICEEYAGKKALHVDGKAVRGASEESKGEYPTYELNAMYEGESIGVIVGADLGKGAGMDMSSRIFEEV